MRRRRQGARELQFGRACAGGPCDKPTGHAHGRRPSPETLSSSSRAGGSSCCTWTWRVQTRLQRDRKANRSAIQGIHTHHGRGVLVAEMLGTSVSPWAVEYCLEVVRAKALGPHGKAIPFGVRSARVQGIPKAWGQTHDSVFRGVVVPVGRRTTPATAPSANAMSPSPASTAARRPMRPLRARARARARACSR